MSALDFEALLKTEDFEKGIKKLEEEIRRVTTATSQETQKMDDAFKKLGTAVGAYFTGTALMGFARQVFQVRNEFQQLESSFTTMLQSKAKADQLMSELTTLAATTPFGLQDVAEGAKQLLAFQVPAQEVTQTLKRMGDVASGLGVPMGRLINVYGQIKAQGKMLSNDLMQFISAGIPIIAELSKVLKISEQDVKELVSQGKVGFAEIQQVFQNMTNQGGLFYNMMEGQSKTLGGQLSNLQDNISQMFNELGKSSEGIFSDTIQGANFLVENYENIGKILAVLIATYGTYRTVLLANLVLTQGLSASAKKDAIAKGIQTIATKGATVAQGALNAVMMANPYVLLGAAIAGLITYMVLFRDKTTSAEMATKKFNAEQKRQNDLISEEKKNIEDLLSVVQDETQSKGERILAFEKLKAQYPDIFEKYKTEEELLKNIANAQRDVNNATAQRKVDENRDYINRLKVELKGLEGKRKNTSSISEISSLKGEIEAKKLEIEKAMKQFHFENRELATKKIAELSVENQAKQYELLIEEYNRRHNAKQEKNANVGQKKDFRKTNLSPIQATGYEEFTDGDLGYLIAQSEKLKNAYQEQNKPLYEKIVIEKELWELNTKIKALESKGTKGQSEIDEMDKLKKEKSEKEKILKEYFGVEQKKTKETQKKSFDEELSELERQWRVRYKLAEKYGEEVAKAQFPRLKGTSYLDEIQQKIKPFEAKLETKGILSDEELKKYEKLKQILDNLKGEKDPFTQWKEGVNDQLATMDTFSEKISFLNNEIKNLSENDISQGRLVELQKMLQNEESQFKSHYNSLLEKQKSFQEKAENLQKQHEAIKNSDRYKNASSEEKNKIDEGFKKELSALSLEMFKMSKTWEVAFGNLEFYSKTSLENILNGLKNYKEQSKHILQPTELKALEEAIQNIENQLVKKDPFKGIASSFKKLKEATTEAKKAQQEYNEIMKNSASTDAQKQQATNKMLQSEQKLSSAFGDVSKQIQEVTNYLNAANDVVQVTRQICDDLGISLENTFGDALDDVGQTMEGAMQNLEGTQQAMVAFLKGDIAGMIAGGAKMIGGIVKAVSGWFNDDKKKERSIKAWKEQVDKLSESYRDLEHKMKSALGSSQYDVQRKQIENLTQQQYALSQMQQEERGKKKSDGGKIEEWERQKAQIERQKEDLKRNIIGDVLQTNAKDLAKTIGDNLVEAFEKGENSAKKLEETSKNVFKNMLKNMLNKQMEQRLQSILDRMTAAAGFDKDGNGSFKGLSQGQIENFRREIEQAGKNQQQFLEQYKEVFKGATDHLENDSLKGAIKGMSEETAGVLAGQFNGIRINTGEILKIMKNFQNAMFSVGGQLAQIVTNTQRLHSIDKEITELNQKIKKGDNLRGIGG